MGLIRRGRRIGQWRELMTKVERILETMVSQEQLDQFAGRIETATNEIKEEVDNLKKQIEAGTTTNNLDISKLEAAVGGLEGIEPPAPAPASSAPAAADTSSAEAAREKV